MTFWTVVWAVVVGNAIWTMGISIVRAVAVVVKINKYKDVS